MKKIGGLTWFNVQNFGSNLQAYALQKIILNNNVDFEFISYYKNNDIFYKIYRNITKIRSYIYDPRKSIHGENFYRFQKKYLKYTNYIYNEKNIYKTNKYYDAFICGSDQIWAPNVYDKNYMLTFVTDKIRIAYAVSIGLSQIPENLRNEYKNNLEKFNYLSIREKSGQKLINDLIGKNVPILLDPTFMLDKNDWRKLGGNFYIEEKYIFCYFLSNENDYSQTVNEILKKFKMKYTIYGISNNKKYNGWMININYAGPLEFIKLIENASIIFTDSYHGTIFSMIFNKIFYTFERFSETDKLNQNSRINYLEECFGIGDRIINHHNGISNKICLSINNYESINKRIIEMQKQNNIYLKNALSIIIN